MSLRRRLGIVAAATVVLAVVCCGGGTAAFFLGGLNPGPDKQAAAALGCGGATVDAQRHAPVHRFTRRQAGPQRRHHRQRWASSYGVPPRGWVIAIATALQESP